MATLVSPGVSVTVTDESFFIPAAASTVPLIFVATADEKVQTDGTTPAAGTYEHNVVRTVTSLKQSLELYGVPSFLEDSSGNAQHGDARNEYGLFGLNQFLGLANRAFVVRSNVNLNDDINTVRTRWNTKIVTAGTTLSVLVQSFIDEYNDTNGFVLADSEFKTTVTEAELISLANSATNDIWDLSAYSKLETDFFDDAGTPTMATSGSQLVNLTNLGDITAVAEVTTVATLADSAGNLDGKYFTLDTTTTDYYVWYSNGTGSPTYSDPAVVGRTGIQVDYTTNDTANTIASLTQAAIDNETAFGAAVNTNIVTITNAVEGTVPDAVDGGASPSAATNFTLGVTIQGVTALVYGLRPTGLANDATVYAATITIDGTAYPITVTGSAAQTYDDLITEIGADLTGATVALTPTGAPSTYDITVTSSSTGTSSTITITDGTIPVFATLTHFTSIDATIPGVSPDAALAVYANGYSSALTGSYIGFEGDTAAWVTGGSGNTVSTEWTPTEAVTTLTNAADNFKFTVEFKNLTSLGANDASRRVAIVTALQAAMNSNTEVRSENFEFNLILCPGYHELADEMLSLSADIGGEAFVVADTPMNMTSAEVVAWAGTNARQSSTNIAYYYPHGLASNIDGKNVFVSASGTALRTYAFSDEVSQLWFAPAGTRRGLVTGLTDIGYVTGDLGTATTFVPLHVNQGQRDDLYKYFTNVNPIAFFPGRGILIWGQKTSAPDASALDRVNVSRLVMYIKRQLRKNTLAFVFEPNDQLTRDNLKAVVDGFLGDIVVKRGLYDFATVCDESNNTPDRIDRNEMYIDVAIKPVKAAEFIFVPIRVVATGADI